MFGGIIALVAALLFFMALSMRRGEKIATLEAVIAARPRVEEKTKLVRVSGPTRWLTRTIEKPGGERVIEKIRYVESSETRRESEHQETPACAPVAAPRWRYMGLEYAPLSQRSAARMGLSRGRFEISARHELPYAGRLEFAPWVGVGVHF